MDKTYNRLTSDAVAELKGAVDTLDWGVRYLVDTELDALRVCYLHRNAPHGTQIKHCPNIGKYSVTVFNKFATTLPIDRS